MGVEREDGVAMRKKLNSVYSYFVYEKTKTKDFIANSPEFFELQVYGTKNLFTLSDYGKTKVFPEFTDYFKEWVNDYENNTYFGGHRDSWHQISTKEDVWIYEVEIWDAFEIEDNELFNDTIKNTEFNLEFHFDMQSGMGSEVGYYTSPITVSIPILLILSRSGREDWWKVCKDSLDDWWFDDEYM